MSKGRGPPTPEPDLRTRVLAASVALIDEEGLGALSMREVARRAGVSHQAPYHHFPDRQAILAAVAQEGFALLAAGLEQAQVQRGSAGQRLEASGRAYVGFALAHRAHFRVMFRPELVDLTGYPEAKAEADRAYAALEQLVGAWAKEVGLRAQEAQGMVLVAWSFAHGLASLALDGPLTKTQGDAAQDAAIEGAMLSFRRLLGAGAPPKRPRR